MLSVVLLTLVLALPALACAAIGFQLYDDEGLFLYMAIVKKEGILPYRDYLLEYGPLFPWSLFAYFSIVEVTHAASRFAVALCALSTCLGAVWIALRCGMRSIFAVLAGISWLYVAAPYLSESMHPGWMMGCGLIGIGLLYFDTSAHRSAAIQGMLVAMLIGYKPHIGVTAGAAVGLYYAAKNGVSVLGIAAYRVFSLLLVLCFVAAVVPVALQYPHTVDAALSLFPCLWAIAYWVSLGISPTKLAAGEHSKGMQQESPSTSQFWTFIGSSAMLVLALYFLASYYYGGAQLLESLIVRPAKLYPLIYPRPVHFDSSERALLVFASLLGVAAFVIERYRTLLSLGCLCLAAVLCAGGTPANVLAWPIVYALYTRSITRKHTPRFGLLLLAVSQLLHTFPMPAAQVSYATVLSWIILFDLLGQYLDEIAIRTLHGSRTKVVLGSLLLLSICLPIIRAPLQRYREARYFTSHFTNSCDSAIAKYSYNVDFANELCAMEEYLREHNTAKQAIFTIPAFLSLTVDLGYPSSGKLPAARWSYLPDSMQDTIVDALEHTPYVVVLTHNRRLGLERPTSAPSGFTPKVYESIMQGFTKVPREEWRFAAIERNANRKDSHSKKLAEQQSSTYFELFVRSEVSK